MDKAAGYLSIMRRAGALAIGEKDSGAAVKSGKAHVLCLAADASGNALDRAETFVHSRAVPLLRVPYEKAVLQQVFSKPGCSMFCISDLGLASAFVGALAVQDPTQYAEAAEALASKHNSAKPRGSVGKIGKRRKNV